MRIDARACERTGGSQQSHLHRITATILLVRSARIATLVFFTAELEKPRRGNESVLPPIENGLPNKRDPDQCGLTLASDELAAIATRYPLFLYFLRLVLGLG